MLALCTIATPALAASTVYLKDGGRITARSAWRAHGRVYVLITRDTLTDFSPAEIDLKRTFGHKQRIVRKRTRPSAAPAKTASTTIPEAQTQAEPTKSTVDSLLRKLPSLPDRKPESLVPSRGTGGTILQHKKEMADRINE